MSSAGPRRRSSEPWAFKSSRGARFTSERGRRLAPPAGDAMEKDMKKGKSESRKRKTTSVKDLAARPKGAARMKGGGMGINRVVVTDGKINARITS